MPGGKLFADAEKGLVRQGMVEVLQIQCNEDMPTTFQSNNVWLLEHKLDKSWLEGKILAAVPPPAGPQWV